jgi:pyridoxal phosphate enzyme (YggS family)
MPIAENIARIEERIQKVCDTSGRRRDEITLMGVTKFQPVGMVEEAFNAGIRCFGESRVKEGIDKFEVFRKDHPETELHLIGALQRNKAKPAALFYDCIQSVDREALITELAKYATLRESLRENPLAVLLELHTGEESKRGFAGLDELYKAAEMIVGSPLMPRGLMTMAPLTRDTERVRASFRLLARAQKELESRFPPGENWACLSMGMSNDLEAAIEEGSTLLRIGSSIFRE